MAVEAAFFSQCAWSTRISSRCARARASQAVSVLEARCSMAASAGLAQPVGRSKRDLHPAPQPLRVDAERVAEALEGEGGLPIAALDPRQLPAAAPFARAVAADEEQAPQAVLEDREPELQLAVERPPAPADRHAAAARLARGLSPAPAKAVHAPTPTRSCRARAARNAWRARWSRILAAFVVSPSATAASAVPPSRRSRSTSTAR